MAAESPRPETAPAAWPRPAQWAFAFLLGAAVAIVVVRFSSLFHHPRPTEQRPAVGIDLNQAGKAELMQLPQVSDRRAAEIMAARDRRGGFASTDDLRSVRGIGPARQAQLQPWLRVEGDEQWLKEAPGGPPASGERSSAGRSRKPAPAGPIDVNRAGPDELERLPGIGKVMAGRIVAERQKQPFRSVEDLRRVAGIGPKTLEKLRPLVRIEP